MDFTICLPTRNRFNYANEAIWYFIKSTNHKILVIDDFSDDPEGKYLTHERVQVIYNKQKSGLSTMWNQFLKNTETEGLIYTSDKVRTGPEDFKRFDKYIEDGFGCVATWLMGIFAFPRELIDIIGPFDEGYAVNGFEDTDFYNKLFVNNVALYVSQETPYLDCTTSWGPAHTINQEYYNTQWMEKPDKIVQLQSKVKIDHNFRPWSESILLAENIKNAYSGKSHE